MNDDIKEILNYLKDDKWDYYPSDMTPYKVFFMEERDKLLDYITNLQQENERLKQNAIHNDKVVDKAKWNEMIYKSRCEKAVEFIEKYCIDDEFYINLTYKEKAIFEVLNILKGDK